MDGPLRTPKQVSHHRRRRSNCPDMIIKAQRRAYHTWRAGSKECIDRQFIVTSGRSPPFTGQSRSRGQRMFAAQAVIRMRMPALPQRRSASYRSRRATAGHAEESSAVDVRSAGGASTRVTGVGGTHLPRDRAAIRLARTAPTSCSELPASPRSRRSFT